MQPMAASRPLRSSWQPPRGGGEHRGTDREDLRGQIQALEAKLGEEIAARAALEARLAQAHKMQALGQLAAGVTHDFNHLLQVVRSGVSLLERRLPPGLEGPERITHMISKAVEHGEIVTRRLLSFAHRCELDVGPVDISALLGELHEMLACTLGDRIAVCVATEGGLRPALADKGQLEAVLVNLVANARDAISATPTGGGRITLRAAGAQDGPGPALGLGDGAYVRLSITDTGAGMDSATLARAEEPFFTTKPAGRGTGLGLAMARDFAERSGGKLVLASAPGRGTTVTLWLPQAASPALSSEP